MNPRGVDPISVARHMSAYISIAKLTATAERLTGA